jgi:uncharacterized protein YycO
MHSRGKVSAEAATPNWIVAEYAALIISVQTEQSVRGYKTTWLQTNLLVQQQNLHVNCQASLFTVTHRDTVLQQIKEAGEHADRVMAPTIRFFMALSKTRSARIVKKTSTRTRDHASHAVLAKAYYKQNH